MHLSFIQFTKRKILNSMDAAINVAMFLPYFLSIQEMLKTFFEPFKNIVYENTQNSTSMNAWVEKTTSAIISRGIGATMRFSLIMAYLFLQIAYVFVVPIYLIATLILTPLMYLFYILQPTEQEKKAHAMNLFMKRHLLDTKNQQAVIEWFERYYARRQKKPWYDLNRLKSQPPLGRDLAMGYTPKLDLYTSELTLAQPHHKYLVGRDDELDVIERVLSKSSEANVLLNGEVGVGKMAIIEGLSRRIYQGSTTPQLAYKRVLLIDIPKIVSTHSDSIKRKEIVSELFLEAVKAKNIILVIQDLDSFVTSDEDRIDIRSVFTKYAQSPYLHIIATSTPYNYQKFIYPKKDIVSLFDKIDIQEVSLEEAKRIVLDIVPDFEDRYNVMITYGAIVEIIEKSARYMNSSSFPEKAIELLDETCIYARDHSDSHAVDPHIVNTVLSYKIHVPTEINDTLKQKLLNLETVLKSRVLFQDHALKALSAALRRSFVDMDSRKKPLASFLFLGPTGVGKTETAKAITHVFFNSDTNMIRLDMANYQTKQDIAKLIGSISTKEPGLLTQNIREKQYGTLLLDELEKAHPDILSIFLSILDEGYYTDGYGTSVDCSNLIIIATSNAGAQLIFDAMEKGQKYEDMKLELLNYVIDNHIYAPEFLNRFDGVIVYKPLYKEAMVQIAYMMLNTLKAETKVKHNIDIEFSPQFVQNLVDFHYDPRYGARNMQRHIQETVQDQISQAVLNGNSGTKIEF